MPRKYVRTVTHNKPFGSSFIAFDFLFDPTNPNNILNEYEKVEPCKEPGKENTHYIIKHKLCGTIQRVRKLHFVNAHGSCGNEKCRCKRKEETCNKKYGGHPSKTKEGVDKIREGWNKKCGGNPGTIKKYKDKMKKTCLKKYGVEYAGQTDIVKQKAKQTNLERFGNEVYFGSREWKEKKSGVFQKLFGVENPGSNREVIKKSLNTKHKRILNGELDYSFLTPNYGTSIKLKNFPKVYRSKWEVLFQLQHPLFEYEVIRIPYIDNDGMPHVYKVDFLDRENKILYEIKAKWKMEESKIKFDAAYTWCKKNKHTFIILSNDWYESLENKEIPEELIERIIKNPKKPKHSIIHKEDLI